MLGMAGFPGVLGGIKKGGVIDIKAALLALGPALALIPSDGDKTYSSGSLVSSIVDSTGVTWSADATKEPTYNEPTLDALDTSTNIRASFSASGDLTLVFHFDVPETVPGANTPVLSFGSSNTTGNSNAALIIGATGILSYANRAAGGVQALSGDLRGTSNTLTLTFSGGTDCTAQLNDEDPVIFSPNTGFSTMTWLHLFSRQPSFSSINGMKIAEVYLYNETVTLPDRDAMLAYFQNTYP